jgi:hypothetical protein
MGSRDLRRLDVTQADLGSVDAVGVDPDGWLSAGLDDLPLRALRNVDPATVAIVLQLDGVSNLGLPATHNRCPSVDALSVFIIL